MEYHICPCCSTEFGNDDDVYSIEQLREMWIAGGANWFFGAPPQGWNPWLQLINAGLGSFVPWFGLDLTSRADATIASLITRYRSEDFELTAA